MSPELKYLTGSIFANPWNCYLLLAILFLLAIGLRYLENHFFYSRWHIRRHFSILDLMFPNDARYYTYITLSLSRDHSTIHEQRYSTRNFVQFHLALSLVFVSVLVALLIALLLHIATPADEPGVFVEWVAVLQIPGLILSWIGYIFIGRTLHRPKLFIRAKSNLHDRLNDDELEGSSQYRVFRLTMYARWIILFLGFFTLLYISWGRYFTDPSFRRDYTWLLLSILTGILLYALITRMFFKRRDPLTRQIV